MKYLLPFLWLVMTSSAATVTLIWDKSLSPEVVRYGVYWRQWQEPGQGSFPQSSKTVPETSTVIADIQVGVPYLYEVTALNSEGLESIPAHVIYTVTNLAPIVVAKPTSVTVTKIYPNNRFQMAVDVRWLGQESIYKIKSKSPVGGSWNTNVETNRMNRITVMNLVVGREYDIILTAEDPSGNESVPVPIQLRTNSLSSLQVVVYNVVIGKPMAPLPPPLPSSSNRKPK